MFSIMILYKLSYLVLDSKYYSASIFFPKLENYIVIHRILLNLFLQTLSISK